MKKTIFLLLTLLVSFVTFPQKNKTYDIVIYGATSAGIAAAVEASRSGKSVIILNPDNHIGGLTTGGLGFTDIGNKMVIGGISREFYRKIRAHYNKPEAWIWQDKSQFQEREQSSSPEGKDAMWIFEPSAAMTVFKDFINENNINIINNERLRLKRGVIKKDKKISAICMESGRKYYGKMFIDATYEGDLMAAAGVSYTYGRESAAQYGEKLNGVQTAMGIYHQFPDGIDPYVTPGNPSSGLLPNVNVYPGTEKSGDKKIQAYCYRMCLTDAAENRIAIQKPKNYDEKEYELLFRYIEKVGADKSKNMLTLSMMPNRKTDSNNNGPFSLDYIGKNYDYPEGNYKQREKILREHRDYQLGLLWTLSNHARVPQSVREYYSNWGLPKDEFIDNGNWTPQLYVREARRMISHFVMTTHHCTQDSISAEQSIGMGAYTMDSHHVQRHVTKEGWVKNEGDVQVGGFKPYPIDYRSIIPKKSECTNLLVPVCLSSSHMAFGSIRMEPVFMMLAQSAAVAAGIAIDNDISVQDVNYPGLKAKLLEKNMILEYK